MFVALALGLGAWAADRVTSDSDLALVRSLGHLPGPWLAGAFVVGVAARRWPAGAVLAGVALALGVIVYYGMISLAGDRPGSSLSEATQLWLAVAVAAGPPFGIAGATWSAGPASLKPLAVGALCGAFAGEALYFALEYEMLSNFSLSDPPNTIAVLGFGLAATTPFVMLRRPRDRLQAVIGGIVCAVAVCAAIAFVYEVVTDRLGPQNFLL
jgi:uncharacterized protein DUF6518